MSGNELAKESIMNDNKNDKKKFLLTFLILPAVNFINIFQDAFAPIFLRQKLQSN
jgi:hypothetical protein